jgi:hypothetical protein
VVGENLWPLLSDNAFFTVLTALQRRLHTLWSSAAVHVPPQPYTKAALDAATTTATAAHAGAAASTVTVTAADAGAAAAAATATAAATASATATAAATAAAVNVCVPGTLVYSTNAASNKGNNNTDDGSNNADDVGNDNDNDNDDSAVLSGISIECDLIAGSSGLTVQVAVHTPGRCNNPVLLPFLLSDFLLSFLYYFLF